MKPTIETKVDAKRIGVCLQVQVQAQVRIGAGATAPN